MLRSVCKHGPECCFQLPSLLPPDGAFGLGRGSRKGPGCRGLLGSPGPAEDRWDQHLSGGSAEGGGEEAGPGWLVDTHTLTHSYIYIYIYIYTVYILYTLTVLIYIYNIYWLSHTHAHKGSNTVCVLILVAGPWRQQGTFSTTSETCLMTWLTSWTPCWTEAFLPLLLLLLLLLLSEKTWF